MADCMQKEGVIPPSALDFAAYRGLKWKRLKDIEAKLSQKSKVLGSMILSRPIAILGEMDVKHPMQLVLDGPMAPSDLQKSLWRHVFR